MESLKSTTCLRGANILDQSLEIWPRTQGRKVRIVLQARALFPSVAEKAEFARSDEQVDGLVRVSLDELAAVCGGKVAVRVRVGRGRGIILSERVEEPPRVLSEDCLQLSVV